MKCKIRDKDGIYLSPWLGQYTRDPEKAGCWSEKSAQNILHSSLPDVSGREWQMIPADETTAAPTEDEADRVLALDWHNLPVSKAKRSIACCMPKRNCKSG